MARLTAEQANELRDILTDWVTALRPYRDEILRIAEGRVEGGETPQPIDQVPQRYHDTKALRGQRKPKP